MNIASTIRRGFILTSVLSASVAFSQTPDPSQSANPDHTVPIYSVTVVQRSLKAVNYQKRTGPTEIDFKGTVLMPHAEGQATIEVKNGYTQISLNFKKVTASQQFGLEYLTYVLWAITPDGKPINLGEVLPDGSDKVKMRVTCPNSTFGLLVTAEPYFSVPYPSNVVVLENAPRPDTIGRQEDIEANVDLLPRGQYSMHVAPQKLPSASMKVDKGVPMPEYEATSELYQARNAVQIARADGADRFAAETLNKAQSYLDQAESAYSGKDFANVTALSRQAVQAASDARSIATRRKPASPQGGQ
jgi:hypothetical protein